MTTASPLRIGSRLAALTDLFAAPLRTSHYLELVNPLWTSHKLQARVVDVWDETADARTLTLRPGRGWRRHRAGQHVRLGVARRRHAPHPHLLHFVRSGTRRWLHHDHREGGRRRARFPASGAPRLPRLVSVARRPQGDFTLPDAVPVASSLHHRGERHHADHEHAAQLCAPRRRSGRRSPALRTAFVRRDLRQRAGSP